MKSEGATPATHHTRPELLDTAAAAAYLDLEPHTLHIWRCVGRYKEQLPYIRIGRNIRYRREHLDAFLAARTVGGEVPE